MTILVHDSENLLKKYSVFTERELGLWALGVAMGFAVSLAKQLSTAGQRLPDGNCVDFIWIWLSSHFAASGLPVRIFDHSAFVAAKNALIGSSPSCNLGSYNYSPTFLFFTYPLHSLPYAIAFMFWIAVTFAIYLTSVYLIIPHRNAILAASTTLPVWMNIRLGHVGFLTAGLIGLALTLSETRPKLAGVFLSLLTFKPQFGVLFPPALAVSRKWRPLIAGTIASLVLAAMAALAFGLETWPAFLHAIADRASDLSNNPKLALPLTSAFSLLWFGASSRIVWTI